MSRVVRSLTTDDLYLSYCSKMKAKGLKPKSHKEYKKFVKEMGKVYADQILKTGIVALPWGLGDIYLKNKLSSTFKNGKLGDKSKVLFNDHTEGIIKKFYWLSPQRKNKKANIWAFSAYRDLKRALPIELRDKKRLYPDFDLILKAK